MTGEWISPDNLQAKAKGKKGICFINPLGLLRFKRKENWRNSNTGFNYREMEKTNEVEKKGTDKYLSTY